MKIQISRIDNDIITTKDFRDILDKGEISHFLIELEIIKFELIDLWEEYNEKNE